MKFIKRILLLLIMILALSAALSFASSTEAKASGPDVIETQYNGIDGWWYVWDGVVDPGYTGFAANRYGTWWIVNGMVDFGYTGIAFDGTYWWRVVGGQLDYGCNSVEHNEYGWWYIRNGRVDFTYTGIAQNGYGWWRIVNGQVDFSCNSVEENEYGWWYLRGGRVDFDFYGIASNNYGDWLITGGCVDFGYSGIYIYNGDRYRITQGRAVIANAPNLAVCSTYGSGYQADSSLIYCFRQIGCTVTKISSYADISQYDGLIVAGGIDIDPSFYGETNYACETTNYYYDLEQFAIIQKFVEAGKPILGVCRGCEILNVYFGGSLYQNISGHRGVNHWITSLSGSLMDSICGSGFDGYSEHHQAIKTLGSGLIATQWASDGVIEAFEHESLPIIATMWHPEWTYNWQADEILYYFAYEMCL